jgi:hypothetical protein
LREGQFGGLGTKAVVVLRFQPTAWCTSALPSSVLGS